MFQHNFPMKSESLRESCPPHDFPPEHMRECLHRAAIHPHVSDGVIWIYKDQGCAPVRYLHEEFWHKVDDQWRGPWKPCPHHNPFTSVTFRFVSACSGSLLAMWTPPPCCVRTVAAVRHVALYALQVISDKMPEPFLLMQDHSKITYACLVHGDTIWENDCDKISMYFREMRSAALPQEMDIEIKVVARDHAIDRKYAMFAGKYGFHYYHAQHLKTNFRSRDVAEELQYTRSWSSLGRDSMAFIGVYPLGDL